MSANAAEPYRLGTSAVSLRTSNPGMNVECPLCDGEGCHTCDHTGVVEEGGFVDEVFKDSDQPSDDPMSDVDQDNGRNISSIA